ncbi:LuxR family transcriptional regulator [Amycolatopsis mediterranei]|uniref:helix-turn-helix transcriptional regulator n=1 Tax=Amycolatopsis mediterranei TaxID=33910 RepID=UPI003419CE36
MAFREHSGLVGRGSECRVLDQLAAAVRTGESHVLVLHGAPGAGKTALLEYLESAATGIRVLRAAGIESEMELTYATLQHLCGPLLDRLPDLPTPQREALETVFGRRAGTPPNRFLVGLAVLSLLSDASADGPVLCVIDSAQSMDDASAQVIGFVARRLLAESVALVLATRDPRAGLLGLPELEIAGLSEADAHALLDSAAPAGLDQHIRDRIVAEAKGNPLALLELPRELTAGRPAGGFGPPDTDTLPDRVERSFLQRVEELPEQARLLLLVAAAEPVGDPTLVWRAAERLGITPAAALDGMDGLLSFDIRVTFHHPLARSALYRAAGDADRQAVHLALAEVTDPESGEDRRAWHLAAATAEPDERVAAELERSAGRARARGGLAADAAFLERSMALTVDATRRAERAVAAAEASVRAGDLAGARRLADIAETEARSEFLRGRAHLVRGRIAHAAGDDDAARLLLAAARQLEPFDPALARETYLLAWGTAASGAADDERLVAISRAIRELPPPEGDPRPLDLVLAGCALLVTEGRAAAIGPLRTAMAALADVPTPDLLKWGWVACGVSPAAWDEQVMCETYARAAEVARTTGSLTELPVYLACLGSAKSVTGDFATAAATFAEAEAVAAATGLPAPPHPLILKALQGKEPASAGGPIAHWAAAVLYNGLGRHEEALSAARAGAEVAQLIVSVWVLPELVEAAVRVGDGKTARRALEQLADAAAGCDTDWARGILARSRALLAENAASDDLYREAIERLGRTLLRPDLARAHLLHGEWLRRRTRRADARHHLRTAHDMFVSIGMTAFAERARRELLAVGEQARKGTAGAAPSDELTPQERQIALLVREGFSNPEVGARLFLSPRTVEWHLRKVFTKLSITSRRQIRDVLPDHE